MAREKRRDSTLAHRIAHDSIDHARRLAKRVPLTPALLANAFRDERARTLLNAARAARLANQLLVLARADGLSQTSAARPLDLKAVCAEAAQDWLDPALDAGLDLGFELQAAWVCGHAHLLREALGNLLHNANEYAGSGARVTVRTALRDGVAVLEVEDNGPGVPACDHERLWQRFQRGEAAVGSGSGLGLAIVRNIAALHGADVQMRAGGGGRGLCVTLRLPAVPPPLPAAVR